VRVAMFTACGGLGQAGVAAVRRTLQLYKSLMRPASLKNTLIEQHKFSPTPCNHPTQLLPALSSVGEPIHSCDAVQVRDACHRAAHRCGRNPAADDDVDFEEGFQIVKT
jgi:hypothetical protein